ncbi:MAG: hypothetical protein PHV30_04915 [Candidatus Margulisbacteria bacterium]|nr:hypothetical protein [Candidatus Margulisiibacteriota bacterium]
MNSTFSKRAYTIHFSICLIGLLKLLRMTATIVAEKMAAVSGNVDFYLWIKPLFFPYKPVDVLFYIVSIIVLFLYFSLFFVLLNINPKNKTEQNRTKLWFYSINLFLLNMVVFIPKNPGDYGLRVLLWILIFLLPLYYRVIKIDGIINFLKKYSQILYVLIFTLCLLQIFSIFSPFVFEKIKLHNEFYEIPAETLINGTYVDNFDFINESKLLGVTQKYDFRKQITETYSGQLSAEKQLKPEDFSQYLNYYYDKQQKQLFNFSSFNFSKRDFLTKIFEDPIEIKHADLLQYIDRAGGKEQSLSSSSWQIEDFINKNFNEINWQILNRGILHHHNHFYGPINELNLGKPVNKTFMQYGWLNITILKELLKYSGGIKLQNYFHLFYSFYYIYYFLFILLLFFLFRKIEYVVAITLFITAGLNFFEFQFLFLGPGANPIRHLFDVPIIFFLAFYMKNKNILYIFLLFVFCLLAIFNNSSLGLFVTASAIATLGIYYFFQDNKLFSIAWRYLLLCILFFLSVAVYLASSHLGVDYITEYFNLGLLGFPLSLADIYMILAVIATGYFVWIKFSDKKKYDFKFIVIFLFLYSQVLLTYYIWGSDKHHFLVFIPIYTLTIFAFLKMILDNKPGFLKTEKRILGIISLAGFLVFLFSLQPYYQSKNTYMNIFKEHRTYHWKLQKADLISTMNPIYFENAVKLIKKYSDKSDIYILSRYDYFIPFLADRYSAMPYFDLTAYIMSDKEFQACVAKLLTDKPEYLFVDSDINRDFSMDIIHMDVFKLGPILHNESISRYLRLTNLKRLFDIVKNNYALMEKTDLLTVYHRINNKVE